MNNVDDNHVERKKKYITQDTEERTSSNHVHVQFNEERKG